LKVTNNLSHLATTGRPKAKLPKIVRSECHVATPLTYAIETGPTPKA